MRIAVCALAVSALHAWAQSPAELARDCVSASLHYGRVCLAADLNADNQIDYAFTRAGRNDALSLRLSLRDAELALIAPDGRNASSYALRDVDGDGDVDIAMLGAARQTVGVFLNDGAGGFAFDAQDRYLTSPATGAERLLAPGAFVENVCEDIGANSDTPWIALSLATPVRATHALNARAIAAPVAQRVVNAARSRAP